MRGSASQSHTSYDVFGNFTSVNRLTHLVHTPISSAVAGVGPNKGNNFLCFIGSERNVFRKHGRA